MKEEPLVFVFTPVHNGEAYLAECIESVIDQSYRHWRYWIINNCSTDSSLSIAQHYAALDPRVSVVNNPAFVSSIENHNVGFRLLPPEARYCKVVSADDWLFPECLERLVSLAEANPSVGIINSYHLSGDAERMRVNWYGISSRDSVFSGRDICRSHLLGGPYVFGAPTSMLYRAELIRARDPFFPNAYPHADASACYECLQHCNFGFVHQILSFVRLHPDSISARLARFHALETSTTLRNLISYGPVYLTREEYDARLKEVVGEYYRYLALEVFNSPKKEFWKFHRAELAALGYRCFGARLGAAVLMKLADLLLNPKQTLEKMLRRTAAAPPEEPRGERGVAALESGSLRASLSSRPD